jgi:predicted enzyme related to lactoylglutathione lyase
VKKITFMAQHPRQMKKIVIILALATSFGFGFAFNSILIKAQNEPSKKVTGIGGIFFKCKDPKQVKEWYKVHLGLNTSPYGAKFEWRQAEDSTKKGLTLWTPFSEKTKYFDPSAKDFMINYRVENMDALVQQLKAEGVTLLDTPEASDFGKFVHVLDIEGNKVELWEPKN